MTEYTIQLHTHGRLVFGPIPLEDFPVIAKLASKAAVIHGGISNHYGATAAFGEPDEIDKWVAEIEESVKGLQPPELRFVSGTGSGMSSCTIVAALSTDQKSLTKVLHPPGRHGFHPEIPHDSADFSRCYKLLTMRPDWVPRIAEVGAKYPETKWPQLAAVWCELTALYEAKKHKELTERIRELKQ